LNYFENKTTNGFTEGCHTKIKMIKRVSFGFRNIDNYIAKMTLAFLPLSFILNYHTV
nr:transposase [Patescibacteria group bacterium]